MAIGTAREAHAWISNIVASGNPKVPMQTHRSAAKQPVTH
jgi:hypothetical protein